MEGMVQYMRWANFVEPLGWNANGGDAGGQGWYDLSIAVYQWQSSTDGTTWTNISGQTTATTTPTVTTVTQYRCALICLGGTPSYSSTVQITMKSPVNCACKPSATCSTSFINTVQITGTTLNNASTGCSNPTGTPASYTQYPVATATATLIKETVYPLKVTTSTDTKEMKRVVKQ